MPQNILPRRLQRFLILLAFSFLAVVAAWGLTQWLQPAHDYSLFPPLIESALAGEPIQPIPETLDLDQRRVSLGEQLFHDPQLSRNGTIACATCHDLTKGGSDGLAISQGMAGSLTGLNSPTVFNIGFHTTLNWDGSAKTLAEQAEGPISSVGEMGGMPWPGIVKRLKASDDYPATFQQLYGDGVTPDNVKDAIATFQRSLITPNAPFDLYLKGNDSAISTQAKEGYERFKSYGCIACHHGMLVGGNMHQALGVVGDYFGDRGTPVTEKDLGRYNVTGNEWDRHVFKVPSLRNIAQTAPYFHDGHPKRLDEAIKLMGKYQLGVDIPQKDIDSIEQFLRSLTGEYQGKRLG